MGDITLIILTAGPCTLASLCWQSFKHACSQPRTHCLAFTGSQGAVEAETTDIIRTISPSDYLQPGGQPLLPSRPCCRASSAAGGAAPSGFFCDPHRARTMPHQYRYLPALAYVKKQHLFTTGWAVVVDEDSRVDVDRLRAALTPLDTGRPLYLGDFVTPRGWKDGVGGGRGYTEQTRGWPPYACGGAGSVFSMAAIRVMDFERCIQQYSKTCAQSDWFIGKCAADHDVTRVTHLGCDLCALGCAGRQRGMQRALRLLRERNCSFAQVVARSCDADASSRLQAEAQKGSWLLSFNTTEGLARTTPLQKITAQLCEEAPEHAAIIHGWGPRDVCSKFVHTS
uniref:N-acetylgalactosaminide beta-1,3-galactosyltransferase n=1 Tax=Chrysotila carterae TaxID=13221 RepID=A0A7S4C0R0_CHRCT